MYQLLIKTKEKSWQRADLGECEPAMNYQVNDIAELKDRQADYSQNLALPLSENNKKIFEHCLVFASDTQLPYAYMPCRLQSNEADLAGQGAMLIIDNVSQEAFNTQILSGTADVFELMNNRAIAEIEDRGVLGSCIVATTPVLPSWAKSAYCLTGEKDGVKQKERYYFLNLYGVIEKLVGLCGYAMTTNLKEEDKNAWLSLASLAPLDRESIKVFDSSGIMNNMNEELLAVDYWVAAAKKGRWTTLGYTILNNGLNTISINGSVWSDVSNINSVMDSLIGVDLEGVKYTSNINGKIHISIATNGSMDELTQDSYEGWYSRFRLYLFVKQNGEYIVNHYYGSTVGEGYLDITHTEDLDVDVSKGDAVKIILALWRPKQQTDNSVHTCEMIVNDASITITEQEATEVPSGGTLFFQNNTGFEKYLDIFKAFVQTYGMTCYADNANKRLYCYTFKQLYDNKNRAKDWSGKRIKGKEHTMSFALEGYGQNNFLRMTDKDETTDRGNFYVKNTTLEKWKDLFTMAWEAGKDYAKENETLAYVPLYEWSKDEETGVWSPAFKGTMSHLCKIDAQRRALHITAQSLIDTYYKELKDYMLVRAKKTEVYLMLKDSDIQDFEPFVPVYMSQEGYYFYVNKITNYVSGKPTKVEMIRM